MMWLSLALLFVAALALSFGASFLSSGWRRRRKTDAETLRVLAMLPGYDCGLCGRADCQDYARAVDAEGADPALCGPGGSRLEARLRSHLSERPGDGRALSLRAVVRCGGGEGLAVRAFPYDGRKDCSSAAEIYGGPKVCKDGCLGLGSCAEACPVGAIQMASGFAMVIPSLCTGCGDCARLCPKSLISLVPRDRPWYVACAARVEPSGRLAACSAACTACGECSVRSSRSEFVLAQGLARENPDSTGGKWAELAAACPTSAIVHAGSEKKRGSPFRKIER